MNHPTVLRETPEPAQEYMTAAQVAEWLGVSEKWVYRKAHAGEIPSVRVGRIIRFRRERIEAALNATEAA